MLKQLKHPFPAIALVILFGFGLYRWLPEHFGHKLTIPVPENLDTLEPQLKAYIQEQLEWARESSDDPNRQAVLGMAYAVNKLWVPAILAFKNIIEIAPNEPHGYLYYAVSSQEAGNTDQAVEVLLQLNSKFPNFAPGFYRMGEILLKANRPEEADAAFKQLRKLAPDQWRGYTGSGDSMLRRNQFAEAVPVLEKAVTLAPQIKTAHYLLGVAYQNLGRIQEAERELLLGVNAVMSPMPDDWSKRAPQHMKRLQDQLDMAMYRHQRGQIALSIEMLKEALQWNPTNLTVLRNMALAYSDFGKPQKSYELLSQALELDPNYLPAHIILTSVCLHLEKDEEAMKHADKAIELSPDSADAYLAKADVMTVLENQEETLALLKTAAEKDPENPYTQLEIGDLMMEMGGQIDASRKHFEAAATLDPYNISVLSRRVELELRAGKPTSAQKLIETESVRFKGHQGWPKLVQRIETFLGNQEE
ncbi:MAG TPA: tetratricopeptide repeat protein [Verrucomicrobiales bacterium]|nr:tetratricopeptide repeat protein [Verrucomicrobiales bacterium]HIL68316.1 tetratricopeptide repeat protein [Verrucomicrobiota bacterium]